MTAVTPRDLGDADLYTNTDRYAMWADLVARDAVVWSEPGTSPGGFWSVFSHQDCRRVLAPTGPFTSEYGMMIGFDAEHPDRAGGQMIVVSDGDRHSVLRSLIGPFLSRANAASLEAFVAKETRELVGELRYDVECDVAADLAPALPAAVVCEILDVPESDRARLIELTSHAFGGADSAFGKMTPAEAHTEILFYFHELVSLRRRRPGDDLVSAMLAESGLSTQDAVMNCDNVLIGGNETTRHSIAGCFAALSTRPGLLDRLRDDPDGLPAAVEEVIRWTSPAMHVLRVATETVTIQDQVIESGAPVVAWLSAANRDARIFDAPGEFRPDRRPNRHLGFGYGPHVCLGAALARIELRSLLSVLAERCGAVRLPAPPVAMRSNLVQGYRHMYVDIDWR
ncbi:cytochrome P450 [Phytohabitans kaempferiae]|uniref:Cytochrome P450 n=1 Tax=Phytohabitans kaempferiae TaxID=1620943 RepID=A0ABV6M8S7_9ACTN